MRRHNKLHRLLVRRSPARNYIPLPFCCLLTIVTLADGDGFATVHDPAFEVSVVADIRYSKLEGDA